MYEMTGLFAEYSITIDELVIGADSIDGNAHTRAAASDPTVSYQNIVTLTDSNNVQIRQDQTTGSIGGGDLVDSNSFLFTGLSPGTYTIKAFLLTSTGSLLASSQKTVTVGEVSGDFVTRDEFNIFSGAVLGSISDIQDFITAHTLDYEQFKVATRSDITDIKIAANEFQDKVEGLSNIVNLVDVTHGSELVNMQRWIDYPLDYRTRFITFQDAILANDLAAAQAAGAAVSGAPLLNAAPYVSGTGGGSFWDAIKNFFAGFGIGATGTLIIVGIIVYLLFIRGGGSQVIRL